MVVAKSGTPASLVADPEQPAISSASSASLPAATAVLAGELRLVARIERRVVEEQVAVLLDVGMGAPGDRLIGVVEIGARKLNAVRLHQRRVPGLERWAVPVEALVDEVRRVVVVVERSHVELQPARVEVAGHPH